MLMMTMVMIYSIPLPHARCDTTSISKRNTTSMNSELFISQYIPFLRTLAKSETGRASLWIRTRVADYIAYDDKCYTKDATYLEDVFQMILDSLSLVTDMWNR